MKKKIIKKDVVSVIRYELREGGQVKFGFVYTRSKQNVVMSVNDVPVYGIAGALAEGFFNKQGLLIK